MMPKQKKVTGALLAVGFVGVSIVLAITGVVVADVLDPGAPSPDDGPVLSDWSPQLVNSSTVDRYQVTIRANNTTDGLALIRQRPQIQSNVTQRINMNASFGDATNPEIVEFEGDDGPQERINKTIFIDNGDVVVELADEAQGAQQQARVTAITVGFDALSAPNPGFYNFTVDMEAQDTTGGQVEDFDTLSQTGIAQVEVVDAAAADPGSIEVDGLETATEASQDERQLEVNATLNNTNTTDPLAADVVYGLEENLDPGYGGTDLLTQTLPNVTVAAGGTANVTFFVDLTEEDEAINTGDDIRHGIDVLGNNTTQQLNITDGPIDHSEDDGATLNRTTGLIQTAVDISDDVDQDVVTVNPRGSPYGENVTVPVDNIRIQGNTSTGKPAVAWTGPQIPDGAVNPPFTVSSTAENTTITGLRIEPLIPEAGGVDVLGGTNHNVLNNTIAGTNTGPPGVGVNVSNVISANVSSNEIANKSHGVLFDNVDEGVVSSNTVRDNSLDGIRLQSSQRNNVTDNEVTANIPDGIRLESSSNNNVTANNASGNGNDGIQLGSSIGNEVVNNDVNSNSGRGIFFFSSDDNNVTSNNATGNSRQGILVSSSSVGNNLTDNTALRNNNDGILLEQNSDNNELVGNNASNNSDVGISLASQNDFNNLTANTANNNGQDGIWLRGESNYNNLTNNLVEGNTRSGIYLGGLANFADYNTLVNNTARGSDYGIWLRNARNNDVSESLVENNNEGIEFSENSFGYTSLDESGNTFTNDTSQNNTNWDFVIETSGGSFTAQSTNPADLPVTNLNIGDSTNPNTTLSFDGNDVEIRSNSTPPATPVGLNDTGRYFDAQNITSNAFLNVSASYDDTDYTGDENDLGLYNYDGAGGLWGLLPSDLDTTNNTVSSELVDFSTFGILQQNRTVNFEVNITGTNSPVQEGDNLAVDTNVTNTGNDNATQIVQLEINGTVLDSKSVTLGPGESTLLTFLWNTQVGDNGTYTATVSSDDDNDTAPVEVLVQKGECTNRRDLGRGQEESECPFDRDLNRGESREELDRRSGRAGGGRHPDSATSRRNRGR